MWFLDFGESLPTLHAWAQMQPIPTRPGPRHDNAQRKTVAIDTISFSKLNTAHIAAIPVCLVVLGLARTIKAAKAWCLAISPNAVKPGST